MLKMRTQTKEKIVKYLMIFEVIILCFIGWLASIGAKETSVYAPFFTVGNKLKAKFIEITGNYINFSNKKGQSGYGFRDSSGVMQFRNSADPKWRVMADTVGGTGDEVTIHKDGGTGELGFSSIYKGYADTSNALWMGFTSDNPMLYDGMRNQMFYSNRIAIYDSAHYDKAIHYAVNNPIERFTLVITDTIMHRGVNDTLPSNIYLIFQDRSGIYMNSTDTLYIGCYFEAGRYQIFHNYFRIDNLSNNKYNGFLYPEWFGSNVVFLTGTNTTRQLQWCFNTSLEFAYSTVILTGSSVNYGYLTDSLWIPGSTSIDASHGYGRIITSTNCRDTTIWVGGLNETDGTTTATYTETYNTYFRNLYFRAYNSNPEQKVTVCVSGPNLGHVWENVQIWNSAGIGLLIWLPNAGPQLTNVWIDNSDDTGLKIHGNSGVVGTSVKLEQNADSTGYQLHFESSDHNYFSELHIENAGRGHDTLIYVDANSTQNQFDFLWVGGSGDTTTVFANPANARVGQLSFYSWTGTLDNDKIVYGSTTHILPVYKSRVFSWSDNSYGLGPIWKSSLGGTDDFEYMPGDTVADWKGFAGIFNRRNNQVGLGGVYNTDYIYPPMYISHTGKVRPLLAGVPYKASTDTLPTLNFTGDTNVSDSLATFMIWVQTHMITGGKIPGKFFRRLFEYKQ